MRRAALCLLAILGAALPAGAEVLRIGNGPDVGTLDWNKAVTLSEGPIVRDICEGLLTFGADGEPVPGVATDWTVSEDGLTWTFRLRPEAKWSDGSPVTAQDFVASWRRVVSPAAAVPFADRLSNLENAQAILRGAAPPETLGVRAEGEHGLVVRLVQPQADFLVNTAEALLCPVHGASGRLDIHNGAYTVAARVPGSHVRLERNPHYWNAGGVPTRVVEYHVTEDQQTELKRFRTGDLHIAFSVPPNQLAWVRANLPEALQVYPVANIIYLNPNLHRPPWGGNAKLRLAISLAIDREALTGKVLRAGERPAYGFVAAGIPGYTVPVPEWAGWTQAEREARARALLAEAGYGPGALPPVELLYAMGDRARQIAIAVASMLKRTLGMEVVLRNEESKVVLAQRRTRQHRDLTLSGWVSERPITYLDLFHGSKAEFGPGYANPAVDALLDEARRQPTLEAMNAMLARAEEIAMAEAPVIPLFQNARRVLVSPKVKGWRRNLAIQTPARFLSLEP